MYKQLEAQGAEGAEFEPCPPITKLNCIGKLFKDLIKSSIPLFLFSLPKKPIVKF